MSHEKISHTPRLIKTSKFKILSFLLTFYRFFDLDFQLQVLAETIIRLGVWFIKLHREVTAGIKKAFESWENVLKFSQTCGPP